MSFTMDEDQRPSTDKPDWWTALNEWPGLITDQHFGYELLEKDLVPSFKNQRNLVCPRTAKFIETKTGHSEVQITRDLFKVDLRTEQFNLEDLEVKVVKRFVVISGNHMDLAEGSCLWSFTRRYMLPHDFSSSSVNVSYLPEFRILQITAGRDDICSKSISSIDKEETCIKIKCTE